MSACFKISRQDFSTLFVSGWGVISFLKLNLLLDWTTTAAPGVTNSACSCIGTSLVAKVVPHKEASGVALVIHGSKTGSGDVVADSTRTQIAW